MASRRLRVTIRGLMVSVAAVALTLGADRYARRYVRYTRLAAPHATQEAMLDELARSLAGDPSTAASTTVTALLPDGTAVRFDGHGPGQNIYLLPDAKTPANATTLSRLEAMCRRAADEHAAIRQRYERAARFPWLSVDSNLPTLR